jgi:prevent-host-death family protein
MSESIAIAVSEAKRQLGAIVDRAHVGHETVYLSRRGKRVVAVVDADEFDRLRGVAEDVEDAAAAMTARAELAETGATPIPWDDVKAELGLT